MTIREASSLARVRLKFEALCMAAVSAAASMLNSPSFKYGLLRSVAVQVKLRRLVTAHMHVDRRSCPELP